MGEGGPLINLGDLSRPATVLIEKVSDAVGGIARPGQIRRVARAEAEAEIIRAEARIQITDMEKRALVRMVREEGQKQENIENITAQAIPHLNPDAKPEKIEKDWLTHFFDRCRLVSDQEMQSLWSRILASEANTPGNFSPRTIDLVAPFSKRDAQLFTNFCTFVWMVGPLTALVFDPEKEIYQKAGITFDQLMHLDNIGLVTFDPLAGYARLRLPKYAHFFYYGRPVTIEFPENENKLDIGNVLLTRAGIELAGICNSKPSEEFFSYVISKLINGNYAISIPISARDAYKAW